MNSTERENFYTCGFCNGMGGTLPNGVKYCNCDDTPTPTYLEEAREYILTQAGQIQDAGPEFQRLHSYAYAFLQAMDAAEADVTTLRFLRAYPDACASAVADAYSQWSEADLEWGNFEALLDNEIAYQKGKVQS